MSIDDTAAQVDQLLTVLREATLWRDDTSTASEVMHILGIDTGAPRWTVTHMLRSIDALTGAFAALASTTLESDEIAVPDPEAPDESHHWASLLLAVTTNGNHDTRTAVVQSFTDRVIDEAMRDPHSQLGIDTVCVLAGYLLAMVSDGSRQ